MPNGKPGDHPLTDLFVHHLEVISPEVDSLFREIGAVGGSSGVTDTWGSLENDPRIVLHAAEMHKQGLEALARRLKTVLEQLRVREL